jgi:hypothetical protein
MYDLFLVNSAMTSVLAWSTNTQNGSQDPEEYIVGTASLPVGSRFIILKHPEAAIRALHLDTERGILSIGTTGATFGHNAASGAFTMAAADAYYAFGGAFTGGSANPGYVYTSDGPRRMFYNADGTPITPGNVLFGTNGGAVLPKPDITAADGVPTGIASFNPFYGTSAGGPHAGAIAALMLQARPSMTLDQMRAAFNASALDIEGLGFDINSGAGIVMAPGAAKAACGYSATPSAATVAWVGDAVTVAIQSGANCPWTISGLPGWISGATSGKGNASVPLVISANPGAARSATVSLTAGSLSLGISTLISQSATPPLSMTATSPLLSGFVGGAYSQSVAASGGAAPYTWSITAGTLPAGLSLNSGAGVISGTPTAAGTSTFTVQVADSASAKVSLQFTLTVIAGGPGGVLRRAGVLAHVAAGAGWDSEIWLVNNSATAVPVRVVFHGDDGAIGFKDSNWNPVTVPLNVTLQGVLLSVTPTTVDAVINGNSAMVITTAAASLSWNAEGWADVLSTGTSLAGFCIFRSTSLGEGIAPLQTQTAPTKLILPFDNTTGQYITGIALGNIGAGAPATITATAWDVNGASIMTGAPVNYHSSDNTGHESATWPANGHDAFFPSSTIPLTDGKRGIIQFQIGGSGALTGVGLRVRGVYPNQTFTSMPTTLQ